MLSCTAWGRTGLIQAELAKKQKNVSVTDKLLKQLVSILIHQDDNIKNIFQCDLS